MLSLSKLARMRLRVVSAGRVCSTNCVPQVAHLKAAEVVAGLATISIWLDRTVACRLSEEGVGAGWGRPTSYAYTAWMLLKQDKSPMCEIVVEFQSSPMTPVWSVSAGLSF